MSRAARPDSEIQPSATAIGLQALGAALRGRVAARPFRRAFAEMLFGNVPLVALCLGAFGIVLVEHAAREAAGVPSGLALVGPLLVELMLREFGPILVGLMFTMRAGAGIAAELAFMARTEQVDALRMCGLDPVRALVAPRLAAGALSMPLLGLTGSAAGLLAATGWAALRHGVDPYLFLSFRQVHAADWVSLLLKTLAIGLAIPWTASHAALSLGQRPEGVGRAVVAGVVAGALAVILLDVGLSGVLWPLL